MIRACIFAKFKKYNSSLNPEISQIHNAKLGLLGNSFKSTLDVSRKKGYSPIIHTGNLILLNNELLEKIKFDKDLLKHPEKLFIYDWVNKKKNRWLAYNKIIKIYYSKIYKKHN